MTADVSHDNQAEVSAPAASSQSVARHHLAASLGFLIVGVLMLAVASLQYVAPDLLSGSGLCRTVVSGRPPSTSFSMGG